MTITIPKTGRKRALLVVDVQPAFLDDRNSYIVDRIVSVIQENEYDLYITVVFYSTDESLWKKHRNVDLIPKNKDTRIVSEIDDLLTQHNPVRIEKQSRSSFHGDVDLVQLLKENQIEDVHIVGTETNDCILATAFDTFDSGFYPYVIEECCEGPTEEFHQIGLTLLRRQRMTNHTYAKHG